MADKHNGSVVPPLEERPFHLPPPILGTELDAIRQRRIAVGLMSPLQARDEAEPGGQPEPDPQNQPTEIRDNLVGLALSGGGIRSATFSLGVMQCLAKEDCLKYVDYLSTVSGGGYIGGSLTWLLSAAAAAAQGKDSKPFGTSEDNFPYGVENQGEKRMRSQDESKILRHLRLHGKYLTPGKGITKASLAAVILRGILLNFIVWLPLLVAFMVVLLYLCYFCEHPSWAAMRNVTTCELQETGGFAAVLWLGGAMGVIFLLASVVYSVASRILARNRYTHRRWFERFIKWPLLLGLFFGVLGTLPSAERWLDNYVEEAGMASLLLGVAGGLSSFARTGSKSNGALPLG